MCFNIIGHQRNELYHYMKADRVWIDENEEFDSVAPQQFIAVTVSMFLAYQTWYFALC